MNLPASFDMLNSTTWEQARGPLRDQLEAVLVALQRFHVEHDVLTNRHSTITASGGISERGRTTAIGDGIAVPYGATLYTGNGTMTWAVPAAGFASLAYSLSGHRMDVDFEFLTTTVAGAINTALSFTIPAAFVAKRHTLGSLLYSDNGGALTVGTCEVAADGTTINCYTAARANWTAAAGTTSVFGSIGFEVK